MNESVVTQHPSPVPRLGQLAPNFSARTTKGPCRLSDYRGRWLLFFSHPADFTPVCTSEFVTLAKRSHEFEARQCSLLGLSVDSLYAHQAWLKAIQAQFGVTITFPLIEDSTMVIGRAYAMVDEDSESSVTMRSTYYIDPLGYIRAINCYPHNVGRSVEEMLRLLDGLQTVEQGLGFVPEGWQRGGALLQPPNATLDTAGLGSDWFCHYLPQASR